MIRMKGILFATQTRAQNFGCVGSTVPWVVMATFHRLIRAILASSTVRIGTTSG